MYMYIYNMYIYIYIYTVYTCANYALRIPRACMGWNGRSKPCLLAARDFPVQGTCGYTQHNVRVLPLHPAQKMLNVRVPAQGTYRYKEFPLTLDFGWKA